MLIQSKDIKSIDWSKGLIPAIIQDSRNLEILMQGWMNEEALAKTIKTGKVTFYSRSKERLWTKGETSGNFLEMVNVQSDCDLDSILILARPQGPTCHTGNRSCFGSNDLNTGDSNIKFLGELENIISDRLANRPEGSYVSSLLSKGLSKVCQKVGEEGVEVALAGATGADNLLDEAADLVFHLTLLLKLKGLSLEDVATKLKKRHQEA